MTQILLFLGFSLLLLTILIFTEWHKKIDFQSLAGLFLFGILISIPFIIVEYLGAHLKFYFVILAFIGIELGILFMEQHVKYFHDLIHHNIGELRIISFFLIGIGFTYSEIAFHIFSSQGAAIEILKSLPIKTAYALLVHTAFAYATSLAHVGSIMAEPFYETALRFASYYIRIAIISLSHFLYVFSTVHDLNYLIILLLAGGTIVFFRFRKNLDCKIFLPECARS
jgi:hypothetical protein